MSEPTGFPREASTYYYAPGSGVISSRSGWDKDATQVLFQCGPTLESHGDRNQGHWMLFRSDWLAAMAKLQTRSGLAQGCEDSNCLSVDNLPQAWTQDGCKLILQEDNETYTYLQGGLTAAYEGQLIGYTRELLYLKPNYLLIRDAFIPVKPNNIIIWHLSTLVPLTMSPDKFVWRADRLFANVVIPSQPQVVTGEFRQTPDQPTPTYRTDLLKGSVNAFVVALEAGAAGQAVSTLGATVYNMGLAGIVMGDGFAGYVTGTGPWKYTSPIAGAHTLFGVKSSTSYYVMGLATQSSAAGVLRFSATLGTVMITEGGSPSPPPPPPITFTGYLDGNRDPTVQTFPFAGLVIQGSGFGSVSGSVIVGGISLTALRWSNTEITIQMPALPAGAVSVQVNGVRSPWHLDMILPPPPPPPPPAKDRTFSITIPAVGQPVIKETTT